MTTQETLKEEEKLRKEYYDEQCEEMEGDPERMEVYENDAELVADWWLSKRKSELEEIIAEVEGAKSNPPPFPIEEGVSDGRNEAMQWGAQYAYGLALRKVLALLKKRI